MRNISSLAYYAFINKKHWSSGNTLVNIEEGHSQMFLFGRKIVKMENNNDDVWISLGGYKVSNTTVDRLSPFIRIRKEKDKCIINEKFEWNGDWFNVTDYKRNNRLV